MRDDLGSDPGPAYRLIGRWNCPRICACVGFRVYPLKQGSYARLVEALRADLGPDGFERETSAGAASLSLDDAAALALDLAGRMGPANRSQQVFDGRNLAVRNPLVLAARRCEPTGAYAVFATVSASSFSVSARAGL